MAMTRTEKDTMGTMVPADRYWGAQTRPSLEHFRIGSESVSRAIRALGVLKKACALVNRELGLLPEDKARATARRPTRSSTASTMSTSRSSCFRRAAARRAT